MLLLQILLLLLETLELLYERRIHDIGAFNHRLGRDDSSLRKPFVILFFFNEIIIKLRCTLLAGRYLLEALHRIGSLWLVGSQWGGLNLMVVLCL